MEIVVKHLVTPRQRAGMGCWFWGGKRRECLTWRLSTAGKREKDGVYPPTPCGLVRIWGGNIFLAMLGGK